MCYNLLKKAGASHLHGKLDDVHIPTVVSFVFTTKTPPICSFFFCERKKKVFIINVYLFPPLDMCVFVYAYRVVRGLSCDYGRVGHIYCLTFNIICTQVLHLTGVRCFTINIISHLT